MTGPRATRFALPFLVMSTVRLVWSASPARAALTLVIQIAASLSIVAQILLVGHVLDILLSAEPSGAAADRAVLPVTLLAVLTATSTLATTVANLQHRMIGALVSRQIWRRTFDVSLSVDLSAYDDPAYYDQAERIRANAATRAQSVVHALVALTGETLGMTAAAASVIALAPVLLPLLLLSGVPLFLTARISGRHEFRFSVAQSSRDRERGYLQAVLTRREEAQEVRAFSLGDRLRRCWESNVALWLSSLRRHVNRRLRLALYGNLAAAALLSGALIMTVILVGRGGLGLASAGAALLAVRLLGGRVGGATLALNEISESALFLEDLEDFLTRTRAETKSRRLPPAPREIDEISVSDVSFSYPSAPQPALREVSLRIARGEMIALVGENGSGKSTLAKLLASLYVPVEGAVYWDGVDIREFDPDSVRQRISAIFQDFVRYQFTARHNVTVGRPEEDVPESYVREAATKAEADGFLAALPAGYDTMLSKEYVGGTDLSIGQWQRVALARAFIRDAPLLILDEPSASLDARAEDALFTRLRRLFAGRTIVVISHRFSTVRAADRIYVMAEGRIVEQGGHVELIRRRGLYAELFDLQASTYTDGESPERS